MNMVAEGVKTTKSAWNLANKMDVEMPILEQIYLVLYTKINHVMKLLGTCFPGASNKNNGRLAS